MKLTDILEDKLRLQMLKPTPKTSPRPIQSGRLSSVTPSATPTIKPIATGGGNVCVAGRGAGLTE